MSTGLIVTLIFVGYVAFFFLHWRLDERADPENRFNGIAPVRFAKHFVGVHVDAFFSTVNWF